jgi:hypothetical protein
VNTEHREVHSDGVYIENEIDLFDEHFDLACEEISAVIR